MYKPFIFYGASRYAELNLETWVSRGIVPVCFADADNSKHFQKISPYMPEQREFTIYSLREALEKYPGSDVYITVDPETEAYNKIHQYIAENGVPPERIGPVPETTNERQCIFYAAGRRAELNLKQWVFGGIVPVCFADSDATKHYKTIGIPPPPVDQVFDILPLHDALVRYPDAFLYITEPPESYQDAYEHLISEGIPAERIGGPPQHCPRIGHYLLINGLFFSACCHSGYAVFLPISDNIKQDVDMYYEYSEKLRSELNEGKLTSCTGCIELQPGRSDEELKITSVNLATGLPGGSDCNFRCIYCNYGSFSAQKFRARDDNILEILKFLDANGDVDILHYEAGEIAVSPDKHEIIKLIMDKKWKGRILSNASVYLEDLRDLLSEGRIGLNVSLDSGTAETFERVKGINCFNKVVDNLTKYSSSGGEIQLKYIVLDGMNCENADIDGFVAIAKNIKAEVVISRDNTRSLQKMPDKEYSAVLRLAKQCISLDLPYTFEYVSADYRDKLVKDGIYR